MTIKIEAKKLREFLNVATLRGKVEEFVLEFGTDGVTSNIGVEENVGATFNMLRKEAFVSYQIESIKIGVKDSGLLLNILSTFDGVIELVVSENTLNIKDEKRAANIINMKYEFVKTVLPAEAKDKLMAMFDSGVKINNSIFNKSVKNSGILGESEFLLNLSEGKFTITVGENNFNKISETESVDYKSFEAKYGSILKDVISVLPESVSFAVAGDYMPCMFTINTEDYICKVMASPMEKEGGEATAAQEETTEVVEESSDEVVPIPAGEDPSEVL